MKRAVLFAAALVSAVVSGQSITATKAYVDGKIAQVTNGIPTEAEIMTKVDNKLWMFQQQGVNARQAEGLSSWRVALAGSSRYSFTWDRDLCHWVAWWMNEDFSGGEETVAYLSDVTNVARSVVNSVWDASLGVAWQARMHNGHLYYIAVTNKQETTR